MPNFPVLSATAARDMLQSGALLIDVRPTADFRHSHLPGSISVPFSQLPQQISRLAAPNRVILLYCTHGITSHSAALVLARLGYTRLYIVRP